MMVDRVVCFRRQGREHCSQQLTKLDALVQVVESQNSREDLFEVS